MSNSILRRQYVGRCNKRKKLGERAHRAGESWVVLHYLKEVTVRSGLRFIIIAERGYRGLVPEIPKDIA